MTPGKCWSSRILQMMRDTGMPNGVGGLGYVESDVAKLADGAYAQQRLLTNAPIAVDRNLWQELYRGAAAYW